MTKRKENGKRKMKITESNPQHGFEIPVKRLYLPYILEDKCPECGFVVTLDLSEEYLSYPLTGKNPIDWGCEKCDHEWTAFFDLAIEIRSCPDS